jgi:hypothetical protein
VRVDEEAAVPIVGHHDARVHALDRHVLDRVGRRRRGRGDEHEEQRQGSLHEDA